MGNQIGECCQQALTEDVNDLRAQTSISELLMEAEKKYIKHQQSFSPEPPNPAKSMYSFGMITKESGLKLQSIDSTKSLNLTNLNLTDPTIPTSQPQQTEPSIGSSSLSEDVIYSLQSSESDNDEILSNDKIFTSSFKNKYKNVSIKIPESCTTSADHQTNLEEATVIYQPISTEDLLSKSSIRSQRRQRMKSKQRYKQIMRAKNRNKSHSMNALKNELSECEIKLKQSQHEKDILKNENDELRKKIELLTKAALDHSPRHHHQGHLTKTSMRTLANVKSTSTEKGYHAHNETLTQTQDLYLLLSPKNLGNASSRSFSGHSGHSYMITPPPSAKNITPSASSPGTPPVIHWGNSSKNSSFITNKSPSNSNDNMNQLPNGYPNITSSASTTSATSDAAPTLLRSPRSPVEYGMIHLSPNHKGKSLSVPSFEDKKDDDKKRAFDFKETEEKYCESVEDCMAIKEIINALKWYAVSGIDHESVYQKMKIDNYGEKIINAYDHIMEYHLNEKNKSHVMVKLEYDEIVNKVIECVGHCSFKSHCNGYKRYLRSKHDNVHKAKTPRQHDIQMYVNTMDGIHCCFMHLGKK